ncbi:glycoside hydrolase family 3 protein [Gordonia sp. NB41Y]|uniref:glycoside hydrolase family 3 N-terminal domain-containing protein n=1 Tax=Gordonia sp. NB41Y TaxID=875808 RepID=UPI00273CA3A0|nr:glycoside hydrolase family 3 protein [Gordonia sp. NB41Y]WLP88938.1 glycoside hydrolase family 3 protein [Gordonia sp. NB41Y]
MGSTRRRRTRTVRDLLCLVTALGTVTAILTACDSDPSPAAGGTSSATTTASSRSAPSSAASSSPASASVVPVGCGADELESMTLRQKLGQSIVVGVTGTADALSLVSAEPVGGIFIGSWTDKSILTDPAALKKVQAKSTVPLMVTVDQEGGRVSRLSSLGIDSPSARELARTQTPEQVRALATRLGEQMKAKGITVDFAPDVDVSDEADDEVIGDRSFSDDPETVTRYGQAFAEGLQAAGIMPVYKHFPGHGHGSGDSHLGVVRTPPLNQLIGSDLVPYKTLLRDPGNAGVMVGHLIVPGLTVGDTPASLSAKAIGMLRSGQPYGGPAFDGVVFSDDLSGMGAITQRYPLPEAVQRFLVAGGDIALWISTDAVPAVLDRLEAAVRSGKLSEQKVNASVVRILRAKGQLTC